MCTEVHFKHEQKTVGSMRELADMLGGVGALRFHDGYGDTPEEVFGDGESCLCPVDIEATFAPTAYIMSEWEDACDWTARKPEWLIEQERRENDQRRYDAAMAETRALRARAQDGETR